ncbi:helix-turn-helix domain-containing protein [Marinoscillum sp.]|uniref:helix-turn-helix domain-containing protein n=1 Tax=Marinoscillum sp. TaxID=2024838 RepID=UPI003BABE6A3
MAEKDQVDRVKAIGGRVKELRLKTGLGYVDFAIQNSLDPKNYWRMEAGQANFTIKRLLRIMEIHNLTMEEFFKGME